MLQCIIYLVLLQLLHCKPNWKLSNITSVQISKIKCSTPSQIGNHIHIIIQNPHRINNGDKYSSFKLNHDIRSNISVFIPQAFNAKLVKNTVSVWAGHHNWSWCCWVLVTGLTVSWSQSPCIDVSEVSHRLAPAPGPGPEPGWLWHRSRSFDTSRALTLPSLLVLVSVQWKFGENTF